MNYKLLQIQKALKAPKSQFNNFGKYHYRNCEDILEALKPLLIDCYLTITDEVVMVGSRYYIKATATFQDELEIFSVSAYAREEESKKGMDGAQVSGAASSYARKYALNGLFLIDDTKDADTLNQGEKAEPKTAMKEFVKKNKEADVPADLGDSLLADFINSTDEDQKRTLTVMAAARKYTPKQPIIEMEEVETRVNFFHYLTKKG